MVGTPVGKETYEASIMCFVLYWICVIAFVVAVQFDWKYIGLTGLFGSQAMIVFGFLMLIYGIKKKGH